MTELGGVISMGMCGGAAAAWQQVGLLQGKEGCIIVNSTNL